MTSLNLVVLFAENVDESVRFYATLGLDFVAEQHGGGPVHHAAVLPGGPVLEIYPRGSRPPTRTRLGLTVVDVAATLRELAAAGFAVTGTVARDPDGNAVELTSSADPVGVYDALRDAATHLGAVLVARGELRAMRAMQDEVEAVPVDDVAAQLAMIEELARRRVAEKD